jgi:hypothetical protein
MSGTCVKVLSNADNSAGAYLARKKAAVLSANAKFVDPTQELRKVNMSHTTMLERRTGQTNCCPTPP